MALISQAILLFPDLLEMLTSGRIGAKGNGLIMLLHGTGKTFAAESTAELAKKPLYTITRGDIWTRPEDVEECFQLASFCVMSDEHLRPTYLGEEDTKRPNEKHLSIDFI